MAIYVETTIRAPLAELWRRTQTPELHERWDLRFTNIDYLPKATADEPQRFRYATRIGFGAAIAGEGETRSGTLPRSRTRESSGGNAFRAGIEEGRTPPRSGERGYDEGERGYGDGERGYGDGAERVSVLRFWSHDPRSLIAEGAGYWKYLPTADGVRFLTRYDYRVRYGAAGRLVDKLLFRPLIDWATAWSFDRLRLWLERDIDPASSLRLAAVHVATRLAVAAAFVYQGLVPKLLALHPDELSLAADAGLAAQAAPDWQLLGCAEVAFGLALLWPRLGRGAFAFAMMLMILATADVALFSPRFLTAAFNPATMNGSLFVLSFLGWLTCKNLPSARRCRRTPKRPRHRSTSEPLARTSSDCIR